jgi:hypothetical protein
VNGDNKPDVIVVNEDSNNVGILLNAGNGTFYNQTTYAVHQWPFAVAIVDVNNDNKPDMIAVNAGSDDVSVLIHC